MKTNHRFVAARVLCLQTLVVALLVSTVKCSSRKCHSPSLNGKIGKNVPGPEKRIGSSMGKPQDAADEGEGLVFEGKFNYQSDIIPIPTSLLSSPATDLFEFFSDPKNRDLAIKGGGNPCESIPWTPELHDEWTSQSKIVKSTPPNGKNSKNSRNEEILAVYSEVPIVPGLSLRAVSYTGCKTMKEPTSALPYYEFTLLKESYQPVGKKAMTWIFDKITGNKNNNGVDDNDEEESGKNCKNNDILRGKKNEHGATRNHECDSNDTNRKTYALSRVMLKPFPKDGGCKICYYGHVKLTLSKRFLHMLPLPTSVVQAKVNKSIRKQLERECTRSIEKFTSALNRWNESGVQTQVKQSIRKQLERECTRSIEKFTGALNRWNERGASNALDIL